MEGAPVIDPNPAQADDEPSTKVAEAMTMRRHPLSANLTFFTLLGLATALSACAGADGNGSKNGSATQDALTGGSAASAEPAKKASNASAAWSTSYVADTEGTGMGGTEFRSLVAFDRKMYAGIGYWEDSKARPGAQVLALDSANEPWRVELGLDDTLTMDTPFAQAGARKYFAIGGLSAITVTTDSKGRVLQAPAKLLLAGPWSHDIGIDIYARTAANPTWVKSQVNTTAAGNVRSFAHHVDAVTGVDTVFAGSSSSGKDVTSAQSAEMYTATLDAATRQLQWSTTPEAWDGGVAPKQGWRVMGFAEANGSLFATVGESLYQRIDGTTPSWIKRYEASYPPGLDVTSNGGLRGLHPVPALSGSGEDFLVATGGISARVIRIMPENDYKGGEDANIIQVLQDAWGDPTVTGALFAYNDMLEVKDPRTGETDLLMGLEAFVNVADVAKKHPFPMWNHFFAPAHYLIRHPNGTYEVSAAEDPTLSTPPLRVSLRTMAISPFDPTMIYAGGFDANTHPVHDTAWALTAPIDTVLHSGAF